MAKLVFITPPFAGREFEIVAEKTTIGRSSHNTLVIEDKSVSSHHCDLMMYGNEFIVSDHGSSNGSFVAGVKVNGQLSIKNGDILRLGKVEARMSVTQENDSSDSVSGMTAIRSHEKHIKHANEHKPNPSPFAGELPPSSTDTGEHTIVMPRGKSILDELPSNTKPPSPAPCQTNHCCCGRHVWLVLTGVVVAVIALIAYLKLR